MNSVKIKIGKRNYEYNIPETFAEMSQQQMLRATEYLLNKDGADSDKYFCKYTNIKYDIWKKLDDYYKYVIKELAEPLTKQFDDIDHQMLDSITLTNDNGNKEQFIGYQSAFANTSWIEFVYADQFIAEGKFHEMAATLYRQQRKDYDGETDRRIPFTIYGTENRLQYFKNIDNTTLFLLVSNYITMRKKYIEERYPHVFVVDATVKKNNSGKFSWLSVHRSILSGDSFFEEEKVNNANVHTVLNRLETVIKQNEELERERRKHNG